MRWRLGRDSRGMLCAAAWAAVLVGSPETPGLAQAPPQDADAAARDLAAKRQQLHAAEGDAARAEADRAHTAADLEAIRLDRVRLSAALIDTAARVAADEQRASDVEQRLELMTGSEDAIRTSLRSRRAVIAEVLAALQRVGRSPLPAVLASPEDVLLAVRTSILLGSVVPELRSATEALASDLAELTRLRTAITDDRARLAAEMASLGNERTRLTALIAARQAAQTEAEGVLDAGRRRAADLALQATSLKDLVGRLEGDVAAEQARHRAAEAEAEAVRAKAAAFEPRDPARLAPDIPFAGVKGRLPLPASGTVIKTFGASDSYGGQEHGLSLATRAGAVVLAPSDGWVTFSGPYRSYGQLVIVDVGGGYSIVIAGMQRCDVAMGQFVLSGEPVGAMGDGTVKTAAAITLGAAQPVLYVEFRKDGAAIDPSPWWAKSGLEKVRG